MLFGVSGLLLLIVIGFLSFVLEFVCLTWSEVCSARVTSLLLLLLIVIGALFASCPNFLWYFLNFFVAGGA